MHEICLWSFKEKEGLYNLEEDNLISISIIDTICFKVKPNISPENLPCELKRYFNVKVKMFIRVFSQVSGKGL